MGEIECTKCLYNINSKCEIGGWNIPKVGCEDGKEKPLTNADRIRAMTDEELVKQFASVDGFCCPIKGVDCYSESDCRVCFASWLKEEAKE